MPLYIPNNMWLHRHCMLGHSFWYCPWGKCSSWWLRRHPGFTRGCLLRCELMGPSLIKKCSRFLNLGSISVPFVASGFHRGSIEVPFQNRGSIGVPSRFHRGSIEVPSGFHRGSIWGSIGVPSGFHRGSIGFHRCVIPWDTPWDIPWDTPWGIQ